VFVDLEFVSSVASGNISLLRKQNLLFKKATMCFVVKLSVLLQATLYK